MSEKHVFTLEAKSREEAGRGASRRLRREGFIPAVVYGAGQPAQSVTLEHDKLLHATEVESFYSSILELKVDGQLQKAIVKDLQRHPFKPKLTHADFLRIRDDVAIHVHVPIHILGEEDAPGVKDGGVVSHMMNEVEISCLPKHLPEYIEVDISALELDGAVHLSELKLPEGVTLVGFDEENDRGVVSIHVPKVVEEPEPEVAAEGEEGAEGEAAEGEAKPEGEGGESKPEEGDKSEG